MCTKCIWSPNVIIITLENPPPSCLIQSGTVSISSSFLYHTNDLWKYLISDTYAPINNTPWFSGYILVGSHLSLTLWNQKSPSGRVLVRNMAALWPPDHCWWPGVASGPGPIGSALRKSFHRDAWRRFAPTFGMTLLPMTSDLRSICVHHSREFLIVYPPYTGAHLSKVRKRYQFISI